MIALRSSTEDAASFRMLTASFILHFLFIGIAVAASSFFWKYEKPRENQVMVVRPVLEPEPAQLTKDIIEQAPTETTEYESPPIAPSESEPRPQAAQREVIQPMVSDAGPREPIPLAKRKRKALTIPDSKEPDNNKKEAAKKPEKPKEDPDTALKKRIAALKEDVEKKKKSEAATSNNGSTGKPAMDGESLEWLKVVKDLIKAHWSISGDKPLPNTAIIIGIQVSDDGKLLKTAINNTSGDKIFDGYALRAIHLAAPFPPLPSDVKQVMQKSGGLLLLRFTSKGLQ